MDRAIFIEELRSLDALPTLERTERRSLRTRLRNFFSKSYAETLGLLRSFRSNHSPPPKDEPVTDFPDRSARLHIANRVMKLADTARFTDDGPEMAELESLLNCGIRENLDILHSVLEEQLRNCKTHHVLRLRLTGFRHKDHNDSKTNFQFCINPRHSGPTYQYSWVKCTANFQLHSSTPRAEKTLCQQIDKAENDNKYLHISINPQGRTQPNINSDRADRNTPQWPENHDLVVEYGGSTATMRMKSLAQLIAAPENAGIHSSTHATVKQKRRLCFNRRRLCFNLALSAFFLKVSSRKQVRWCQGSNLDANIYFCQDPGPPCLQDQTQAYLSYPIDLGSPEPEADRDLECDLRLLELGKLLVEVRFWRTPDIGGGEDMSMEKIRQELESLIIDQELNGCEISFVNIVKACLDSAGKFATGAPGDRDFLEYMFSQIIQPLAAWAEIDIAAEDSDDRILAVTEEPRKQLEELPHSRVRGVDSDGARLFMHKMRDFTNNYVNKLCSRPTSKTLPGHRNNKVRIAVIDSGVCSRDLEIRLYMKNKRIADVRNFSSLDVHDWEDIHGHGTTVAKIALEVAPQADIFIAKVVNSQDISDANLFNVAKAIDWAVQVWKVDIINLSLAMKLKLDDIDESLSYALIPGSKIIFAAAHENVGRNERPSWPGSKTGVIAIHSTDGLGNPLPTNASVGKEEYFATLGSGIPVKEAFYKTKNHRDVYATGASYATPIAAGIAANVLEILRHEASERFDDVRTYFYNGRYIKTLFEEMSQETNGCRFVQPWTFWEAMSDSSRFRDIELKPNDEKNIIKVLELLAV
ncbi:subtilisin, putative [Cordyceps militaris CM01]|uniref:Subtilisin, putative n=1 Tax=Cordyceps militaris (strain CM01) TaxID=983644 RepID=G3JSJ0_CORMM|nr:subtilisin, putative [Cordyceps militaris CM01]EGX88836.1 subtilisin, putative [Cordyceps militaris CM01]